MCFFSAYHRPETALSAFNICYAMLPIYKDIEVKMLISWKNCRWDGSLGGTVSVWPFLQTLLHSFCLHFLLTEEFWITIFEVSGWAYLPTRDCTYPLDMVSTVSLSILLGMSANFLPVGSWVRPQPLLHTFFQIPGTLYFSPISSHIWTGPAFYPPPQIPPFLYFTESIILLPLLSRTVASILWWDLLPFGVSHDLRVVSWIFWVSFG